VLYRAGKASSLALPRRHASTAWLDIIAAPARGMRAAAWALAVRLFFCAVFVLLFMMSLKYHTNWHLIDYLGFVR
jgi:hypothetical protein